MLLSILILSAVKSRWSISATPVRCWLAMKTFRTKTSQCVLILTHGWLFYFVRETLRWEVKLLSKSSHFLLQTSVQSSSRNMHRNFNFLWDRKLHATQLTQMASLPSEKAAQTTILKKKVVCRTHAMSLGTKIIFRYALDLRRYHRRVSRLPFQ